RAKVSSDSTRFDTLIINIQDKAVSDSALLRSLITTNQVSIGTQGNITTTLQSDLNDVTDVVVDHIDAIDVINAQLDTIQSFTTVVFVNSGAGAQFLPFVGTISSAVIGDLPNAMVAPYDGIIESV